MSIHQRFHSFAIAATRALDTSVKRAAYEARGFMLSRIRHGQDVNLVSFTPYASLQYKGLLRPVDLYRTGAMYNAVQVSPIGRAQYRVHVPDPRQRKKWRDHQTGTGQLPIRQAFGVDMQMDSRARQRIRAALDRVPAPNGKTHIEITIG